MGLTFYGMIRRIFGECVFRIKREKFGDLSQHVAEKGINIFHIRSEGEYIIFSVALSDTENIISASEDIGCIITEQARSGLPFYLAKHIKRPGIAIGIALFCAILFASQLFVWEIKITGNVGISDNEILKSLSDCGIKIGSFIPGIDVHAESNELILNMRDLSSAAISIEGNVLKVSVLERVKAPELTNTRGYYNVIAKCDGYILDIDAAEGKPEVKKGDVVQKGELLINSFMENPNGSFRVTHARGKVYAAVSEIIKIEIPYEKTVKEYTGRVKTKRVYSVLGVNLFSSSGLKSPYDNSDAVFAERYKNLFGFIKLPLKEYSAVYYEYEPVTVKTDFESAKSTALDILADKIAAYDEELLDIKINVTEDNEKGICFLEADALFKRDIALEKEMTADDQNCIFERFSMASE